MSLAAFKFLISNSFQKKKSVEVYGYRCQQISRILQLLTPENKLWAKKKRNILHFVTLYFLLRNRCLIKSMHFFKLDKVKTKVSPNCFSSSFLPKNCIWYINHNLMWILGTHTWKVTQVFFLETAAWKFFNLRFFIL